MATYQRSIMNRYQLLKLRSQKNAARKKLIADCQSGDEVRDMTPDEKKLFDDLSAQVAVIKGQLEKLSAMDADEEDEDAETEDETLAERSAVPARETRSARVSEPIGQAPAIHTREHSYFDQRRHPRNAR